jgi:hypothetical protein
MYVSGDQVEYTSFMGERIKTTTYKIENALEGKRLGELNSSTAKDMGLERLEEVLTGQLQQPASRIPRESWEIKEAYESLLLEEHDLQGLNIFVMVLPGYTSHEDGSSNYTERSGFLPSDSDQFYRDLDECIEETGFDAGRNKAIWDAWNQRDVSKGLELLGIEANDPNVYDLQTYTSTRLDIEARLMAKPVFEAMVAKGYDAEPLSKSPLCLTPDNCLDAFPANKLGRRLRR